MKDKKMFLIFPLLLCFIFSFTTLTDVISKSKDISSNVIRLHIIANSDKEYDQELKLKVRDAVSNLTNNLINKVNSFESAIKTIKNNLELINSTSQDVIKANGYVYDVSTSLSKEYFNTRYYENFTLPSGEYNSLKIVIGEGSGHNWWCVVYPSVCLNGATDEFKKTLNDEEIKLITNSKYIPKFKIIEIINKLKYKIIS